MTQPHKKYDRSRHKLIVRILAILMAALFVLMLGSEIFLFAYADAVTEIDTLKAQQSALQEEQEECQKKLDALAQEEQSAVDTYLLLSHQNEVLADQINATNELIANYDEEISDAANRLEKAQAARDQYFNVFCTRVSQMEQGGSVSIWEAIFSAATLTELLTSLHDMQSILSYDSSMMEQLDEAEQTVADAEAELESQRSQQAKQLEELEAEQAELQENEAQAAAALEEIQDNQSLYESQLSAVASRCEDLEGDILEAETLEAQAKAQELTVRAPEAEADTESSEEEEPVQDGSEDEDAQSTSDSAEQGEEETVVPAEADTAAQEEAAASAQTSDQTESADEEADTASSVTGADVVAYALQFVGNPYVWGGTSLTDGCDCSGFVMSVYANFGYSLPHFSGSLRCCGTGVSYSEAQPGDIICYDGHVGIYMGGGQMVNAFDSKHGIIICSVNQQRLIAVRRIL